MTDAMICEAARPAVPVDQFRQALGQLAAGVSIIATALDGDCRGVTATAVCSVTDTPGTVLVCVNRNTGTGKMIAETGRFSINVLGAQQEEIAKVFAGMAGLSGADRFAHGQWDIAPETGLPCLREALVNLECRVSHMHAVGSHDVFFGDVFSVRRHEARPLIYFARGFHETAAIAGAITG